MDGGSSCAGLDLPQPLPSSYTTTGGHQEFFSGLLEGHAEHDCAVGALATAYTHAVARIAVVRIAHELVTAGQGDLEGPARPQRNFKGQEGTQPLREEALIAKRLTLDAVDEPRAIVPDSGTTSKTVERCRIAAIQRQIERDFHRTWRCRLPL